MKPIKILSLSRLTLLLLLTLTYNCQSIDVKSLRETEIDKESVKNMVNFKSVHLSNVGILIEADTKSNFRGMFGNAFTNATETLIKELGGVEVVAERNSWENQRREAEAKIKQSLKEVLLNKQGVKLDEMGNVQKLEKWDKEKEMERVTTKFSSWFEISAALNYATYHTVYNPPQPVKDYKGNIIMTLPSWKTTVIVYVFFKVTSTDPGQPKSVVLIQNINNSFSKSFSHNPSQQDVVSLLPEAITYCYEDIKPELQELFPVNSYLTDLREEKSYGRVIGGKDIGITEGRVFDILEKGSIDTAMGIKELFHPIGNLKVLEVMDKESWGKISGSKENIKRGMNVIIRAEKRNIFDHIWRFIKSNIGLSSSLFNGGTK